MEEAAVKSGRGGPEKQNKKETKQKQQQKLAVVSVVPALEPERLRRPVILKKTLEKRKTFTTITVINRECEMAADR